MGLALAVYASPEPAVKNLERQFARVSHFNATPSEGIPK